MGRGDTSQRELFTGSARAPPVASWTMGSWHTHAVFHPIVAQEKLLVRGALPICLSVSAQSRPVSLSFTEPHARRARVSDSPLLQHLLGPINLGHHGLGGIVLCRVGNLIGVVLLRELAVRLRDLLGSRVDRHTEYLGGLV